MTAVNDRSISVQEGVLTFHHYDEMQLWAGKKNCKDHPKLDFWYILTSFPHKRGSFALSVDVFKNIHQNLKFLNVYEI